MGSHGASRAGSSGGGGGGNKTISVDKAMENEKNAGTFEIESYVSNVDNPAFAVSIINKYASSESIEKQVKAIINDPEFPETANDIKSLANELKNETLAVSIEIPKYQGTDKQVKYANKLAEAFAKDCNMKIAGRWNDRNARKQIRDGAKSKGFEPTANGYAKYMLNNSSTLKAIQNTTSAGDVISLLKGKIDPDHILRSYDPSFRQKSGYWDKTGK